MNGEALRVDRRGFLKFAAALAGNCWLWPGGLNASTSRSIKKAVPSTGEMIPVIGMGTSRTFDAVNEPERLKALALVLEAFFQHGGTVIDSSPIYGSSEQVIGMLLQRVKRPDSLFAATKVWTDGRVSGERQMERSLQLWGVERFDLMQIHNLRDWQVHLETLKEMKAQGRIRYLGITTSHGRSHTELESVLDRQPFDFVQLTYNIENREAERVLLPLALERGIGVIVNRPFARGALFNKTRDKPLPVWASQIGCRSWGQFLLKYAVSHPAVSCAIPATSKTRHMLDNMGAGYGVLPDSKMRERMQGYLAAL